MKNMYGSRLRCRALWRIVAHSINDAFSFGRLLQSLAMSDLNDCQTQLSTKELQLFWTAETHSRFGDDVCEDYGGQKHSTNSLETVRTGCSFNRLFMTTASYAFGNLSRVHTMVTKSLSKPAKICRNSLSRLITQDQNGPRHPTYPKSSFSSTFFYYYCLHFCE